MRLRSNTPYWLMLVAFGLLGVLLWLPRLMPYTLMHAVVPVFLLGGEQSNARRVTLAVVGVALPGVLRLQLSPTGSGPAYA